MKEDIVPSVTELRYRLAQWQKHSAGIVKMRVDLRNAFLPSLCMDKNGDIERIYPQEMIAVDEELAKIARSLFNDIVVKGSCMRRVVMEGGG